MVFESTSEPKELANTTVSTGHPTPSLSTSESELVSWLNELSKSECAL